MSDPTNPYAALSLIVAPAVLTNASSILVLSTSNRLARAVDRARALATELDTPAKAMDLAALRLSELDSAARRAVMLLGALRLFYASIGSFAAAALTSLIGAALLGTQLRALPVTFETIALAAGFGGFRRGEIIEQAHELEIQRIVFNHQHGWDHCRKPAIFCETVLIYA